MFPRAAFPTIAIFLSIVVVAAALVALPPADARAGETTEPSTAEHPDVTELLRLHQLVIDAHLANDAEALVAPSSDDFVVGSRGEVLFPTKEERVARLGPYLAQTRFAEYRDLVPPVVSVSQDGTLGWVICQVIIAGTREMPSGEEHPVDSTWAWIELYEKRDGNWVCVGNVSTMKPVE